MGCIEEPLHIIHIGSPHALWRVSPDAVEIQKWALNVKASNHPGNDRISFAKCDQLRQLTAKGVDCIGDDRGKNAVDAVGGEFFARTAALLNREVA